MNITKVIKGIALSIISLAVGFVAMVVPFRMLDMLSTRGMRILFIIETAVYFIAGIIVLLIQDKKIEQKEKSAQRHKEREIKIQNAQDNWYNIAA